MLSLGILGNSASTGGIYSAWTKYETFTTQEVGRMTWNGGTAVFANGYPSFSNESAYGTDPRVSVTNGAGTLDYSTQLASANGVVISIEDSVGTRVIQRSTNSGVSWSTVMNTADTGDAIRGASYKSGRWVVAEYGDNDVWTSDDDGATWTLRSGVLGSALQWINVTNNGTNFIALRNESSTSGNYYYSADGTTWTAVALSNLVNSTSQAPNLNYANPISAGTLFIAHLGDRVRTSTDGITWTTKSTGLSISNPKLAYGNGTLVAIDGTANAQVSYDQGATWETIAMTGFDSGNSLVEDITFYDDKFWVVSQKDSPRNADLYVLE